MKEIEVDALYRHKLTNTHGQVSRVNRTWIYLRNVMVKSGNGILYIDVKYRVRDFREQWEEVVD